MKIRSAVVSVHGRRAVNEDNYYINGVIKPQQEQNEVISDMISDDREGILFSVCDGLGGEGNGEIASHCAVKELLPYKTDFQYAYMDYLHAANHSLQQLQEQHHNSMDSTFTGLFLKNGSALVLNLGDSRVYRLHQGKLEQLSSDHSEFSIMLKYGVVKKEDYYTSSTRSHLTRTLGQQYPEDKIEPWIEQIDAVTPGDEFLLCSDGLCGFLRDEEIQDIMMYNTNSLAVECCKDLVAKAYDRDSDDNITVMIVKVD